MSLNPINITNPANARLTYQVTAKNISARNQVLGIDSANNLGYGLGKIIRGVLDLLYQSWQKVWISEPSVEELATRKQVIVYRRGLRECIERLDTALDNVRKNPKDPGALQRIKSLASHCADYLQPQNKPELHAYQLKLLQPLEEKISKLAQPRIKNALRQLLPILFQAKRGEEKRDLLTHAGSLQTLQMVQKEKRALQQTGGWPASFNLATLSGANGFAIPGIAAGGGLGYSVSTAGDLNGDGKNDLVLSAPSVSAAQGEAYVIFGQAGGWGASFNLASLNGTNGFAIPGLATDDYLGGSVSPAGDLNGDGKGDLVLGANGVSSSQGEAYVLFGQAGGWPASFNLANLNGTNGFAIPGIVANGYLGASVSSAGDLNGDGKHDLVLGAYGVFSNTGAAYVLFGQAGGWPASFNLANLNGTNGFAIPGIAASGDLGESVSSAGDLNGDGKDDLVLGASLVFSGQGEAYVVFGQAGGWPASFNLASLNGTNGFAIPGIAAGGELGRSVSTAGDFNGDGKDDLVLGAWGVSFTTGAAYVLFGQASGWPASFNLASLNGTNGFAIPGLASGGVLGISVSTAGDLNGDGKDDLVLGAWGVSSGQGEAYVLFGKAGGWPASFNLASLNGTNGFAIPGIAVGGDLGISVSTAGDLNCDGKDDLVLGAKGVASGNGEAYVLFGRNTSALATPAVIPIFSPIMSLIPSVIPTVIISTSTFSPTPFLHLAPTSSIAPTLIISIPTPSTSAPINIAPVTIEVKIPLNLTSTFIPISADILSFSNNTVTVSLVDNQGYEIVFTSNYSAVPLSTPFSPIEVISGFSIARGNATSNSAPVFEGCNAADQCAFSNSTTLLQQAVAIQGVNLEIVIPIVVGVTVAAVGGGLIFYFTYYRKLKERERIRLASEERTPSVELETRMKKS